MSAHKETLKRAFDRGFFDYTQGKKVTENPYAPGVANRAWYSGWKDASEKALRRLMAKNPNILDSATITVGNLNK